MEAPAAKTRDFRKSVGRHMTALVLITVVATLLLLLVVLLRNYRTALELSSTSSEVRGQVGQALGLIADAEAAQRSFLLIGDAGALEPYDRAKRDLPAIVDSLSKLTVGDPEQQLRARNLQNLLNLRFAVMDETVALWKQNQREAALAVLRSGPGSARMTAIRQIVAHMDEHESRRLQDRTVRAHRQDQFLTLTLGALILLSSAIMGTVLWSKNRELTERRQAAEERDRLIAALERSNRDLDQFAYVASHDLKAPLRGIANLSQWIQDDLGGSVTRDLARQLELMRVRVHRMEALIEGILSYARAGRATSSEAVDVSALVDEVVELLAPGPATQIHKPEELPWLETEKAPLQQVFLNLLGNAFKHAERPDVRIDLDVADRDRFVEFSIADNGPGIAPAYHEKIWSIFQTLQPRDRVEGTGIGLAVVKKIVEARGGRAWVESEEGAGATFRFLWPKLEARSDAAKEEGSTDG